MDFDICPEVIRFAASFPQNLPSPVFGFEAANGCDLASMIRRFGGCKLPGGRKAEVQTEERCSKGFLVWSSDSSYFVQLWMLNVGEKPTDGCHVLWGFYPMCLVGISVIPIFPIIPKFPRIFFLKIILDIQNVLCLTSFGGDFFGDSAVFLFENPVDSWSNLCRFCFDSALVILMIGAVSQKGEGFV